MIYEEIDHNGIKQFSIKKRAEEKLETVPHIKTGEHTQCYPIDPCPWTLPPEPEPYETIEIFWGELRQFVWSHLDLEDENLYDIFVAWVLASWTPERWQSAPYLHFHGPSNSGKTRGLDVLNQLAYRPLLSPSVSAASIYRALDVFHPTFLLDEFELYEKMKEVKADIIGILNAGYKKGQYVLRTDKVRDGVPVLHSFEVFGFKAIGSIMELPTTLNGRSIRFPMSRAIRKVKRLMDREAAKKLRGKLLYYRFQHVFAEPPMGNPINLPDGRLIELYTPLCMVCPDPKLEQKLLQHAMSQYKESIEMERVTDEARVYNAIIDLLREKIELAFLQQEIRDKLNEGITNEKELVSKRKLGYLIRRLGFQTSLNTKQRLMEVQLSPSILERRKQRYVLPEEYIEVEGVIKQLQEQQQQYQQRLLGVKTLSTTPSINVKTVDTASRLNIEDKKKKKDIVEEVA